MDITAQVAAERALKESEEKFRNITNLIPQMVWSINVDGTEDYFNARWHAYTGLSQIRLAGEGWRSLIHPDDLPAVLAAWKRSFADNTPFECEHRLVHHADGYRWVLNRALPCRDGGGRVTHWMGTLTDIHDQKAGEQALRAASARKDEFLAMLAHELRTPDRSQVGLGLGLALVKSLVQLHGGRVEAYSAGLGKGSTFSVTLDVLDSGTPADAGPGVPAAAALGRAAAGGRRVLIVDDNVDAAESLAEILGAFGHRVTTASTPHGGLAIAAENDWPDVFILDIGLPEIDGYELVRRLRALPPARPALFVALSGYGQAHDKVLSLSAGFDQHFVKPVDLGALVAAIDGAAR
ncbi:MAG: hypothetical protein V7631_3552 [Massilia sp.]